MLNFTKSLSGIISSRRKTNSDQKSLKSTSRDSLGISMPSDANADRRSIKDNHQDARRLSNAFQPINDGPFSGIEARIRSGQTAYENAQPSIQGLGIGQMLGQEAQLSNAHLPTNEGPFSGIAARIRSGSMTYENAQPSQGLGFAELQGASHGYANSIKSVYSIKSIHSIKSVHSIKSAPSTLPGPFPRYSTEDGGTLGPRIPGIPHGDEGLRFYLRKLRLGIFGKKKTPAPVSQKPAKKPIVKNNEALADRGMSDNDAMHRQVQSQLPGLSMNQFEDALAKLDDGPEISSRLRLLPPGQAVSPTTPEVGIKKQHGQNGIWSKVKGAFSGKQNERDAHHGSLDNEGASNTGPGMKDGIGRSISKDVRIGIPRMSDKELLQIYGPPSTPVNPLRMHPVVQASSSSAQAGPSSSQGGPSSAEDDLYSAPAPSSSRGGFSSAQGDISSVPGPSSGGGGPSSAEDDLYSAPGPSSGRGGISSAQGELISAQRSSSPVPGDLSSAQDDPSSDGDAGPRSTALAAGSSRDDAKHDSVDERASSIAAEAPHVDGDGIIPVLALEGEFFSSDPIAESPLGCSPAVVLTKKERKKLACKEPPKAKEDIPWEHVPRRVALSSQRRERGRFSSTDSNSYSMTMCTDSDIITKNRVDGDTRSPTRPNLMSMTDVRRMRGEKTRPGGNYAGPDGLVTEESAMELLGTHSPNLKYLNRGRDLWRRPDPTKLDADKRVVASGSGENAGSKSVAAADSDDDESVYSDADEKINASEQSAASSDPAALSGNFNQGRQLTRSPSVRAIPQQQAFTRPILSAARKQQTFGERAVRARRRASSHYFGTAAQRPSFAMIGLAIDEEVIMESSSNDEDVMESSIDPVQAKNPKSNLRK